MRAYDIIQAKRDGKELNREQIQYLVLGYTAGKIPDYQMAAFCMAVYFRGMSLQETTYLTEAMAESGEQLDLLKFGSKTVDKHSTGGVGDKTTLIVAPIVASLGGIVAKMSGRALGYTGGTVDKLESISGYRTQMSKEDFLAQVGRIGIAVVGQSGNLVPADKKIYALRDVTATVESIPLIASSIMSKKLAAGSHHIVLDVKVGSGAFMKTLAEAQKLADLMIRIGKACGRKVSAVLTNMDVPLGNAIGNNIEVQEAVAVLKGESCPDLREISIILSTEMLCLCHGWTPKKSRQEVEKVLKTGVALEKFKQWIGAQGGKTDWIDCPEMVEKSKIVYEVNADKEGWLTAMNAQKIGQTAVVLGAGRERKEDSIDFTAGVFLKKKIGEYIKKGETIALLYTSREKLAEEAKEIFLDSLEWGNQQPKENPLLLDVMRMEE